jgi:hypothetical protein
VSVAKQRLYRTVDDRVVFEGDPDAAYLLAAEGDEIPEGYKVPSKAAESPANKADAKPENKSSKG